VETTTTTLLSQTEDTDLAKAILDLTNQQNTYQAALRSGASIIQPSLLDFLR
jgi:flagellar hook-associated protein 3 FlgL